MSDNWSPVWVWQRRFPMHRRSAASRPFRRALGPLNDRTPFLHGAVPQEQIDEVLIWHPQLGRHFLEVVHRRSIEANGDLALESIGVRVLAGLGKIVFTSHRSLQYSSSSCAVARLAEISRNRGIGLPVAMTYDQAARLKTIAQ